MSENTTTTVDPAGDLLSRSQLVDDAIDRLLAEERPLNAVEIADLICRSWPQSTCWELALHREVRVYVRRKFDRADDYEVLDPVTDGTADWDARPDEAEPFVMMTTE
jgi:hypothetical protein